MPRRVLEPYRRYQEASKVHKSLANSIGMPYRRECSIPQGCPLSVMVVALTMRASVIMLRPMIVIPKVLLDDVCIIATGAIMLRRLANALQAIQVLPWPGSQDRASEEFQLRDLASSQKQFGKHVAQHHPGGYTGCTRLQVLGSPRQHRWRKEERIWRPEVGERHGTACEATKTTDRCC